MKEIGHFLGLTYLMTFNINREVFGLFIIHNLLTKLWACVDEDTQEPQPVMPMKVEIPTVRNITGNSYLSDLKVHLDQFWMNVVQQVDAAKDDKTQPTYAIWNKRCALPLELMQFNNPRCCDGCVSYSLEVIRDFLGGLQVRRLYL